MRIMYCQMGIFKLVKFPLCRSLLLKRATITATSGLQFYQSANAIEGVHLLFAVTSIRLAHKVMVLVSLSLIQQSFRNNKE